MKQRPNDGARREETKSSESILLFPPIDPQQDRKRIWLEFCRDRRTPDEQAEVERIKLVCQSFRESAQAAQ